MYACVYVANKHEGLNGNRWCGGLDVPAADSSSSRISRTSARVKDFFLKIYGDFMDIDRYEWHFIGMSMAYVWHINGYSWHINGYSLHII